MSGVRDFLGDHRDRFVDELVEWCRIPSVAGAPEHADDVRRSARWLADALRSVGFPEVELWPADAVFARWCAAPGAPTVLVYSHHDVRPPGDAPWETSPFEPVVRDGAVHARGASDAKGQVLSHLWGLRAHLRDREAPAVNLVVLVEGEEEVGSAHLSDLLEDPRLAADLVVFTDTLLLHADHPAVCTSVLGTTLAHLEIRGPARDVHSGAVSGTSPNPVHELCRVLALLHDDKGRVALPGFYDRVREPSDATRAAYADLPFDEDDWVERTGTRAITGEPGYSAPEALWTRPTLEVLTLRAGDVDGPPRATIPSVASADMSIRTVDDQTTGEIGALLERWLADTVAEPYEHEVTLSADTAQEAYRTPDDLPALRVLVDAVGEAFGRPVGIMGNAGGGPANQIAERLDAPLVFFGTGLPEDHWHAADERARVDVLLAGAAALAHFWGGLADG
ncbi:M20/M25/M40 family metallo-hydrolase [Saccharothrix longispora]|uniref:Acetylornithine deacetylase/succinyl-diaminopimelate desuccinylase-like protein n=1 Tax=Saccharothrix longispora TaxID=33920 RepID=A0ABU1PNQ6_9PSEU|nr:M20/M25/M40 family metallo-hydrolase [Saccharothrix longispora]MDR6592260.1 acetylornithine deacetylase/succinyl-diaminopimelate desuccinylase-like protein [Saccharothrix longispora]